MDLAGRWGISVAREGRAGGHPGDQRGSFGYAGISRARGGSSSARQWVAG